MSLVIKLPDGNEIEIGIGDSRPPGVKGGQHTNVNRTWYRTNSEWIPCGSASTHRIITFAQSSQTLEEFEAKLAEW